MLGKKKAEGPKAKTEDDTKPVHVTTSDLAATLPSLVEAPSADEVSIGRIVIFTLTHGLQCPAIVMANLGNGMAKMAVFVESTSSGVVFREAPRGDGPNTWHWPKRT